MKRPGSVSARWGLLAVTLVLATALVVTTLASHRSIVRASSQLSISQGETLLAVIRRDLNERSREGALRRLPEVLDRNRPAGLRYLAIVQPSGDVDASAGDRAVAPDRPFPIPRPGGREWLREGDVYLLVAPGGGPRPDPQRPARRPGEAGRPDPPREDRQGDRRRGDRRPGDRRPGDRRPGDLLPGDVPRLGPSGPDGRPEARRPPRRPGPESSRGGDGPRQRGGVSGLLLAIEFEASTARSLVQQTSNTLNLAAACAVLLMAAVLLFWQQARARERAQRRLAQQERLSSLGEMSAVLAHEIRNPLASLKGHAQLLAEKTGDDHPEARKVRRIVDEAARLEKLTTDLLSFVRSGTLERAPTDPLALVDEVREELGDERIRVDGRDAPRSWSLDAARLHQVLSNLLRNALQASPEDGRVEVTVSGGRSAKGSELRIAVRDHGPGLPAGREQEIFEPFVTHRTRGTGLGLAVARRIVELHGGTLAGRNHPGGGAAFEIRIPKA